MIRFVSFLGLIALAVLVVLVTNLSGATAILFVFIGMPALGLALGIYLFTSWRAGTFHFNKASSE